MSSLILRRKRLDLLPCHVRKDVQIVPGMHLGRVAVADDRKDGTQMELRPLAEPRGQRVRQEDGKVSRHEGERIGEDADPASHVLRVDVELAGTVARIVL